METPDVWLLSRIDWQFWCTFTLRREVPNYAYASMWTAWLRDLSVWSGVKRGKLLWVRRRERGETTSRLHFHALVAGLPYGMKTETTAFALKNNWEAVGGGMSRVYVYESTLPALEYMVKGLVRDGAQQYESRKFGKADAVTLSEGLQAALSQKRVRFRALQASSRQTPLVGTG